MTIKVSGLSKSFGGLRVLNDVNFAAMEGKVHAIIGPNGAGKTTFVNVVTGIYRRDSGSITLYGTEISRMPPHRIAKLGIARTFQIPKPFPDLTVMENVLVGHFFGGGRKDKNGIERAMENIKLVGLAGKEDLPARQLTSAQMKFLDLARALSSSPKFIFIDELGAGLSANELSGISDLIRAIRDRGISIIYIGHIMRLVRDIAEKVTVFSNGSVLAEGSYTEVTGNPSVKRVYLGDRFAKG